MTADQTAGTGTPGHSLTPRMADLLCGGCDCPKNRCNDYGCSSKCCPDCRHVGLVDAR